MTWLSTSFEDFNNLLHESEIVEEPVPLEVFLHEKKYMGIKQVSEKQKRIIEVMSQIFLPHTLIELYGEEEGTRIWTEDTYGELVILVGKGGGKDFSNRLGFAYAIYKLHCLKNPVEYYGKAPGTYIDLLNIAVNADQARNVFFNPLRNIMKLSPWFQSVGFEIRKSEIEFNERPIRLYSGNSEAESWEGLDLLLVVLDEIAAFKVDSQLQGENKNRLSASALYQMSKLSVISRFPSVGKCSLISFPRHRKDFIMQRYGESANEAGVFRLKAPTWEMNPLISREDLEPEFKRNPINAEARFGVNPPEAETAYFRDAQRVRACFRGIPYEDETGRTLLREDQNLFPLDENGRFKEWFKAIDGYPRFIHVDLAKGVRDRAALCMTHSPGTRKIMVANDIFESLPVVKMDLIKYWDAIPGQEIDFADIRQFIILLSKRFPIGLVTFDQWQSLEFIANLNKRGINADQHSVKLNDYDNLSTSFYDGRFRGYFNKLLVEDELLELVLINGRKVEHQCLVGETRIPLLDGSHPQIKDLVGKEVWVYSSDGAGRIVPGKAIGKETGQTNKFIDVILDNGYVARCTPEHKWLLRDGSYKQAKDLLPKVDRLMPIKRNITADGYERISNGFGNIQLTHRMVAEFLEGRKVDEGEIVHHKDHNRLNNSPNNVGIISLSDHSKHHTYHRYTLMKDDNEVIAEKERRSKHMIEVNKRPEIIEKRRQKMIEIMQTPEGKARVRKTNFFREDINLEALLACAIAGDENKTQASRRLNCNGTTINRVLKDNGLTIWEEVIEKAGANHKIRAIIPVELSESIPVYDLTVDFWNNFAITGGVFIHNSGMHDDGAQALAGSVSMTTLNMNMDQELELDILGTETDWEEYEMEDAMDDDLMKDGRRNRRTNLYANDSLEQEDDDEENEFSFRSI